MRVPVAIAPGLVLVVEAEPSLTASRGDWGEPPFPLYYKFTLTNGTGTNATTVVTPELIECSSDLIPYVVTKLADEIVHKHVTAMTGEILQALKLARRTMGDR